MHLPSRAKKHPRAGQFQAGHPPSDAMLTTDVKKVASLCQGWFSLGRPGGLIAVDDRELDVHENGLGSLGYGFIYAALYVLNLGDCVPALPKEIRAKHRALRLGAGCQAATVEGRALA